MKTALADVFNVPGPSVSMDPVRDPETAGQSRSLELLLGRGSGLSRFRYSSEPIPERPITVDDQHGHLTIQNFEPFSFATTGKPGPNQALARHISNLLVPAVTKAAIDLWIARAGLDTVSYQPVAAPGTSLKVNPYEVTIVQNLFQILVAEQSTWTPVWEAGFKATTGPGRPTAVDIVLEEQGSTPTAKYALLEFSVSAQAKPKFDDTKIERDLSKLAALKLLGAAVKGLKQVYYVTIAGSPNAGVYSDFKAKARAAAPGSYLGARRFPIFSPGGWMYATVAVYE